MLPLAQADELSMDSLKQQLASPDYETRKSAVTELLHTGEKRKLSKQEIDLLLPLLKSDPDWRIKVRITGVLPYAENADWVLTPLLDALNDRQEEGNGGGNVPSYACSNLSRLGDGRALKPMQEWLEYLESHPNVYPGLREKLIDNARKSISELQEKLKKRN